MENLTLRDRGFVKIKLTFDIDKYGVMIITSHVLGTDNIKRFILMASGEFYSDK